MFNLSKKEQNWVYIFSWTIEFLGRDLKASFDFFLTKILIHLNRIAKRSKKREVSVSEMAKCLVNSLPKTQLSAKLHSPTKLVVTRHGTISTTNYWTIQHKLLIKSQKVISTRKHVTEY